MPCTVSGKHLRYEKCFSKDKSNFWRPDLSRIAGLAMDRSAALSLTALLRSLVAFHCLLKNAKQYLIAIIAFRSNCSLKCATRPAAIAIPQLHFGSHVGLQRLHAGTRKHFSAAVSVEGEVELRLRSMAARRMLTHSAMAAAGGVGPEGGPGATGASFEEM